MDKERFYQLLNNARLEQISMIEVQGLKEIVNKYPYFSQASFLYLKALMLLDNNGFNNELHRLSIYIKDRKALFYYIFSEEFEEILIRSDKKEIYLSENQTGILLDAFFGNTAPPSMDLEHESNLLPNDYLDYMMEEKKASGKQEEKEENSPAFKHQDVIDTFIELSEDNTSVRIRLKDDVPGDSIDKTEEVEVDDADDLEDDTFFTVTLARIYIKQKRYDKAHKIIKHLSLNYPEKNIYFADQLSFLDKLIINSKSKDIK